jgi:type IV secretion system protein VirB10
MSNYLNDQFENWKTNGEIEQVPGDMFGRKEAPEEPKTEPNKAGMNITGIKKASFAELRQGRKIPRLKKSMVLTVIAGGIFAFLIIVNLFLQKKESQKKYFNEQKNNIATGNDFSLGDMESRRRQSELVEITESDDFYFQSAPAYTPLPDQKPSPKGGGAVQSVSRSSGTYYSESDLQAIRAQIGKEGGYGSSVRTVSYNSTEPFPADPAGYFYNQPGMDYTRQKMEEINRITQAANGISGRDTTRYSDAGKYNPNNPSQRTQGMDVFYLNDDCLFPGTIIHAILVSRIDTDYPGPIHARVTENVYDSMTGKNLLIPQGTVLQGNYSSSSFGVSKVQIAWESMVINYGGTAYQVSLGGMAGIDKRGRAGIAGTLDDHYFEWLKAAGVISFFTLLNSEIMYQTDGQTNPQIRELIDINQGIVNRIGDRLIERALDIQPTVRVANGTAVSVSVNTAVHLRPFPSIDAEEKWVRK